MTSESSKNKRGATRIHSTARRIFILCLIFILSIAASGCMENSERLMREYLNEKYPDQEFITISINGGGYFGQGPKYMTCYPKGGDPEVDKVIVYTGIPVDEEGNKGEREFRDNYFAILIREDVEADVLNILLDMNLSMKVYYQESAYYGLDYDSTNTYEDLKKDILEGKSHKRFDVGIYLYCKDVENRKQYAKQIFDTLLSENGIAESVDLFMIADETIYSKITRKNHYDLINANGETIFNFYESTATYKGPYSEFE